MKELLSRITPQLTVYKHNRKQCAIQLEEEKEMARLEPSGRDRGFRLIR